MKRWIAAWCGLGLAAVALASPESARGQSVSEEALASGGIEVASAVSFSIMKESGDDESTTVVNVPVRVGFMIVSKLELELEALLSYVKIFDEGETGVIGAGHLLYHFGSGRTVPYVLAGAGYGNAMEFIGIAGKMDSNLTVLRAGGGVKTFFGRHSALRLEYRFTHYRGTEEPYFDLDSLGQSDDIRVNDHKILVGISLWL